MGTADFKHFIAKINSDEKIRTAFADRFKAGGEIPAEQLIAFAGEQGYAFTVEEAEGELSDEALEGVAGGAADFFLKLGDIEGESLRASTANNFEEIKVTYSPQRASFAFYGSG